MLLTMWLCNTPLSKDQESVKREATDLVLPVYNLPVYVDQCHGNDY